MRVRPFALVVVALLVEPVVRRVAGAAVGRVRAGCQSAAARLVSTSAW